MKPCTIVAELNNIVLESRKSPKLEKLEKAIIEEFADRVSKVLDDFESLEKEGEVLPQDILNSDFRKKFIRIFSFFLGIPMTSATGIKLTHTLTEHFQDIWLIALNRVMETIQTEQTKIGVESWGLNLGVGFPIGISGTISVTFKRAEPSDEEAI